MNKTRPCKIGERFGKFHVWENVSKIYPPSLMVGGHNGGVISQSFALVEFEDGSIERCQPYDVVFIYEAQQMKEKVIVTVPFCLNEKQTQCCFCKGKNENATIVNDCEHKEYFVYCLQCGIETKETFKTAKAALKAFTNGETQKINRD